MRDRLIELINQKQVYGIDQEQERKDELALLNNEELADHLLAEGVIIPPCKVGDIVYSIKKTYSKCHLESYWDDICCCGCEDECDSHSIYEIQEETVLSLAWYGKGWEAKTNRSCGNYKAVGIYITREEAERALKRSMRNEKAD